MRLLRVSKAPRLPLIDCELGSQMIALIGQTPRPNRRRRSRERLWPLLGATLGLAAIAYSATVLLFTF